MLNNTRCINSVKVNADSSFMKANTPKSAQHYNA